MLNKYRNIKMSKMKFHTMTGWHEEGKNKTLVSEVSSITANLDGLI